MSTQEPDEAAGPLTKDGVLALLDAHGFDYTVFEHPPIRTVAEGDTLEIPFAEDMTKNLFLRDSKKRNYYIVTLPDHKQVSLKDVQTALGSTRLSFASEADLRDKIGLWPGAVTPLGALNDGTCTVEVAIDKEFAERGFIGVHPCDNSASVRLHTDDLIKLLREHGSPVHLLAL